MLLAQLKPKSLHGRNLLMARSVVACALIATLVSACFRPADRVESSEGGAEVAAPPSAAAVVTAPSPLPQVPTNDSLLVAFEQLVLALGNSRALLAQSLGTPASINVREAENAEGVRDSLITVSYEDITFILRKPPVDGREYFSNVIVADSGLALPGPVTPHRTTLIELTNLVGTPHRVLQFADSAVHTYDVPRGPVLQFYLVDSILRKVRWVYELG